MSKSKREPLNAEEQHVADLIKSELRAFMDHGLPGASEEMLRFAVELRLSIESDQALLDMLHQGIPHDRWIGMDFPTPGNFRLSAQDQKGNL